MSTAHPNSASAPMMRGAGGMMNLGDSVYERLLRERIIFLGSQVDDVIANQLAAQMLLLSAEDPRADISLWISSPGGSVSSMLAIHDVMRLIPNDVSTLAMGMAASAGQFLLSAGTPGKRYALPHARILMHQPLGGIRGTAADVAIQAEQLVYIKRRMQRLIAFHSGQPVERIEADSDRDKYFTAEEAKEYGLIDHAVSTSRQIARIPVDAVR